MYRIVYSEKLSINDDRYVIINKQGRIIDDANGYGFKSIQTAMKTSTWKNEARKHPEKKKKAKKRMIKDKPKVPPSLKKKEVKLISNGWCTRANQIEKWFQNNEDIFNDISRLWFQIEQGEYGEGEKLEVADIRALLKERNVITRFSAEEIYRFLMEANW